MSVVNKDGTTVVPIRRGDGAGVLALDAVKCDIFASRNFIQSHDLCRPLSWLRVEFIHWDQIIVPLVYCFLCSVSRIFAGKIELLSGYAQY